MGNYGFKVSKPGFDVTNNNGNISQLLDSNNVNLLYGGTALSGESSQSLAQSITPPVSENIISADLKLFAFGTPTDNVQLDVVSALGAASLGSVVIPTSNLTSGAANNFAFSPQVSMSSAGTYYLQLSRSGARDTVNYWSWYIQFNTNPYADGNIFIQGDGTWSSAGFNLTSDFYFKVYTNSATDDQLVFSSKYNVPKTYASGTSNVVVSAGVGTTTIAHGLPTTPIALVYMESSAGANNRYLLNAQLVFGPSFAYSVNGTNLIVNALGSPSAGTYNFYYYTFVDAL